MYSLIDYTPIYLYKYNILYYDAIDEIEDKIPSLGDTVPNNQYDSSHTIIATFNNAIDVDNFLTHIISTPIITN